MRHGAAAGGVDGLHHAPCGLKVDVGDNNLHAVGGQQTGRRLADAGATAADDGAVALEAVFHGEDSILKCGLNRWRKRLTAARRACVRPA